MRDLHEILNPEQYEAATAKERTLLVLAAAGTGKTQTLVYRVAHLIDSGIPADAILLLTFTNRAATEMLERAVSVAGTEAGYVWGGTFHSICNRFLRSHAEKVGFSRDFTIADRDDSRKLIEKSMEALELGGKDFPKKEVLSSLFGYAANSGKPLEQVLEERMDGTLVDPADVIRVHDRYERTKRELGVMDFDDLLLNGLRLLEENEDVRSYYHRRFAHVLVDEYQDTNVVQSRFVDAIVGNDGNLMAVGDDFQCIYTWRGADVNNILRFPERYPDARIIKLERNYRSTPQILAVANVCVANSANQFQKTLTATRNGGDRPFLFRVRDGIEQSRTVATLIRQHVAAGRDAGDIAVLYRAHFHSIELQMALGRSGVPYVVTSGQGVFEQAHVRDMLSLLRVVDNPSDRLAFDRLVSLLPGIGPKSAEAMWNRLGGRCDLSTEDGRCAFMALLKPAPRQVWMGTSNALRSYFDPNDIAHEDVVALVDAFLDTFYAAFLTKKYEDSGDRIDDVREVAAQVANSGTLSAFLQEVALLTNAEAAYESKEDMRRHSVRLSTIHQAKGLEWPIVIILWAVEGMFPSSKTLVDDEGEAEERRLFYVAVTRARNQLAIFTPEWREVSGGGVFTCKPSRYVAEIPQSLLQIRHTSYY
ncbi:MAG: ATP-dependent helicase [Kiritimatiellae bacterium]|nr:ATP-dependent helicase [Kiritimatiellia bacterium]